MSVVLCPVTLDELQRYTRSQRQRNPCNAEAVKNPAPTPWFKSKPRKQF